MSEMKEVGEIIRTKKNLITVRFLRKSSCAHCNMCAMKPNEAHVDMTMENTLGCQVGDKVEVNISNGTVLKMSLLIYVLPLLIGFIGFLTAYLTGLSELLQFGIFIVALAMGFLILKLIDKRYALSKKGKPYLVRIISDSEE